MQVQITMNSCFWERGEGGHSDTRTMNENKALAQEI